MPIFLPSNDSFDEAKRKISRKFTDLLEIS
jgi:hypothetical protein